MTIIDAIIILFACFAVSRAFLRFKSKNITASELFFWVIIWVVFATLITLPGLSSIAANLLGIGRGADAAFLLAVILLYYMVFRLYVKIDHVDKDLTNLVSELAKKSAREKDGHTTP